VSTFTPAANSAAVVREIAQVIREVQAAGVTEAELAEAQSYHVGHFPLGLETSRALGNQVITMELYDLGLDYLKRYCDQIRGISLKAASQAAREHLQPAGLVTLVLGPAAQIADSLQALGPVQIIDQI
jgi:zinc protease